MGTINQKYSELEFSNAFMFSKVMKNRKLCKQLLEVILGVKIRRIVYQEEEKTLDHTVDSKSVRLDVYIEDDEATKVFLNPVSDMDDVDEELRNFLSYVASGEPVDAFTQELMQEVEIARTNKDWEVEYMGWMADRQDAYNEGHTEGLEQGRELGGLEILIGFVQDGLITVEQAAARISMTVEEFERRMESLNKEE